MCLHLSLKCRDLALHCVYSKCTHGMTKEYSDVMTMKQWGKARELNSDAGSDALGVTLLLYHHLSGTAMHQMLLVN